MTIYLAAGIIMATVFLLAILFGLAASAALGDRVEIDYPDDDATKMRRKEQTDGRS